MRTYIGVKVVKAEPMDYHTAGKQGLIRDYKPDVENQHGYKVVYEDGYESWTPATVFHRHYREVTEDELNKLSKVDKETGLINKVEIIIKD